MSLTEDRTDLLSLPDDVLIHIFEDYRLAAKQCKSSAKHSFTDKVEDAAETLSLVCQSFRRVVLSMPRLWQEVTLERDPRLYFERSGGVGYIIDIDLRTDLKPGWHSMPSYMSFSNRRCSRAIQTLRAAIPHLERCKAIFIRATNEFDLDAVLEYLERAYSGKILTSLKILHLDYGRDISTDGHDYVLESVLDPNGYRKTCFCSWNMPALQTVNAINVIPLLAAPSVTSFRLDLMDDRNKPDYRGITWGLQTLTITMASFINLRELTIKLRHIKRFHGQDMQPIELIQVHKLCIEVTDVYLSAIEKVLNRISTPNAVTLELSLATGSYNQRSGSPFAKLQAFFPKDACYWPRLESLDLTILIPDIYMRPTWAENTWETNTVQDEWVLNALTNLPPIRELTLTAFCGPRRNWTRSIIGFREYGRSTPPPLKILRFTGVSLPFETFLPSIQDIVCSPGFEAFHIVGCPYVNVKDVQRIMDPEKIVFEPFESFVAER